MATQRRITLLPQYAMSRKPASRPAMISTIAEGGRLLLVNGVELVLALSSREHLVDTSDGIKAA